MEVAARDSLFCIITDDAVALHVKTRMSGLKHHGPVLCFCGKRKNKVLSQAGLETGVMARLRRSSARKTFRWSPKRRSQEGVALARQNTWAGRGGALRLLKLLLVRHRKVKRKKPGHWGEQLLLAIKTSWTPSWQGQPVCLYAVYKLFMVAIAAQLLLCAALLLERPTSS